MSASICISGSSARSMSPDSCLSIHLYLRILCKIHVSGSISQQPYVSGSSTRSTSSDNVSASLYLTDFSARSMSPDSCLSIFISHNPLQDPRLQAHVSASLHLRILYKIHVFGFMSQHLRISGSSARSMCPIHVLASRAALRRENTPVKILFNVSRRRNAHLTSGDAFCVAPRRENSPTEIRLSGFAQAKRKFWPAGTLFCGPAQAKRKFWPPESRCCGPAQGKPQRPEICT